MARILDRLVGHRATLASVLAASHRDRLASTLLFAGPSGVGKRLAALALAQDLVCETSRTGACGVCGGCVRIEKQQSESLMMVEPQGAQIKIEQTRDILQFISLRALGRARIVIIDQAHLLGPQAANSLLKSLEEPPAGTFFILVTSLASAILPTIRSRAQLVRFRPLAIDELRRVVGAEVDDWVLNSARGSVESARRILEDRAEFQEIEEAARTYLAASMQGTGLPGEAISNLRELLKDRSAHGFIASLFQGAIRDGLRVQAGLNAIETDRLGGDLIGRLAARSPAKLEALALRSVRFESDLAGNIDRGLILETFALDLGR